MNVSTLLGFLIGGAVIVAGALTSTPNWHIFLDKHAFLVVFGGTLSATLVSFPMGHLFKLTIVFIRRMIGTNLPPHILVVQEVVRLAKGNYADPNFLANNLETIKVPFLKEAVQLQTEGGISDAKIDTILRKRAEVHLVRYNAEAHIFKTMARFPPAFGLLGAVLGIVALMAGLGSPDSFKTIGPSMAMALVATLYGIAIANFIFVPLGENFGKFSKEDNLMRNIVIDSIKLLRENEHPLAVEEYLKSYLLTSERARLKPGKEAA